MKTRAVELTEILKLARAEQDAGRDGLDALVQMVGIGLDGLYGPAEVSKSRWFVVLGSELEEKTCSAKN